MGGYINRSGNYRFEELGVVHVNVKLTARTVRARWRGGALVVSAPTGIEYDELLRILRGFVPRLEAIRPDSLYHIGQEFDFGEFTVSISQQTYSPEKIIANFDKKHGNILVGTQWDINSADTIKTISRFLCRMAQRIAPDVLIPRARELAVEVDCHPGMWTISNGHRVLGHCSSKGVIALSYALMFFPQHLRDYVVYHELAHLTEMNHSPRFHQICDLYCKGREKELEAQLRQHKPPIV